MSIRKYPLGDNVVPGPEYPLKISLITEEDQVLCYKVINRFFVAGIPISVSKSDNVAEVAGIENQKTRDDITRILQDKYKGEFDHLEIEFDDPAKVGIYLY